MMGKLENQEPKTNVTTGGGNLLPSFLLDCERDRRTARELLPDRDPMGHKGTFGKVLCLAGSRNMAGAAVLAGRAAYRSGCGMVKILSPACNRVIFQTALPEALYAPLEDAASSWKEVLTWGDVILAGPGMGTDKEAHNSLRQVLARGKQPLVLDADGLNLLADSGDLRKRLKQYPGKVILTPHVGELVRLARAYYGKTVPDADRLDLRTRKELAEKLAHETGCIVVAKADLTFVCTPGDEKIFCNDRGNSGMATAGSGDVLAGCIAGLLAQGLAPREAAVRGVCLHALAGDHAAEQLGEHAVMAMDLAEGIGKEAKRKEYGDRNRDLKED